MGDDPTTHPTPLSLSTIRSGHPRLWFNGDNVAALRSRWTDPAFAALVNVYAGKTDPLSLALEALATENGTKASQAAAAVPTSYQQGGGGVSTGYVDTASLVFDWCYPYLSSGERSTLASAVQGLRASHLAQIRSYFRFHEMFNKSSHCYVAAALAIEGEPGISSQLQMAQNMTQNLQELGDEVGGDGYRDYFYQGTAQILPFLMWSNATDLDMAARSSLTQNLPRWMWCKLSPTLEGFVRGSGDHAAFAPGHHKWQLDAGGFYAIASHFNDQTAQWVGDLLRTDFGQTTHWMWGGASFISLALYDPTIVAQSPYAAAKPTTEYFNIHGAVHNRETFDGGADTIHSWFYCGPCIGHSSFDQNHYTIWRGDDMLVMRGGNYLGSPADYKTHYQMHTIALNSIMFDPTGSSLPDHEGGQNSGSANLAERQLYYPVAERVGSWSGQHLYRGVIDHYENTSSYTVASGDATLAYDPDHVDSAIRDFVHIKPDIYLIRDRFSLSNVSTVRSLVHSREKPIFDGTPTVIQGSSSAGVLEATGSEFKLQRGTSEARVKVLWPSSTTLRFVGGEDYEAWANGSNSDPWTDCQDWLKSHWELAERVALIEGQWRTEIETTPAAAGGNVLYAVYASGIDPASPPTYSISQDGTDLVVQVTSGQTITEVTFPIDDAPVVTSGSGDTLSLAAAISATVNVTGNLEFEVMATYSVDIPESFVALLDTAVASRVNTIRNMTVVTQKILPHLSESSMDDLTQTQQIEVILQVALYQLENNSSREVEAAAARATADAASLAAFDWD